MQIEFDPHKRLLTWQKRRLDFARAAEVFAGSTLNWRDERTDYGEPRWITFGLLDARWVVVVWAPRGAARRIISMRRANDREITAYAQRLG